MPVNGGMPSLGRPLALLALNLCALAGCAPALPVEHFAGDGAAFDPVTFFTGHVRSWGVVENRDGAPTGRVRTDCVGVAEGDGLRMTQRLTDEDGVVTTREWRMHRLGGGRFDATANDMVGTGTGQASGRAFHWTWVLATRPGQSWRNVTFEQWFYLMDDGAMLNRTVVTKLGVIVAEVSEQFVHVP